MIFLDEKNPIVVLYSYVQRPVRLLDDKASILVKYVDMMHDAIAYDDKQKGKGNGTGKGYLLVPFAVRICLTLVQVRGSMVS